MTPTFSIIIPTFNRPKQLFSTLQSILNIDFSQISFEVIVVDDGGCVLLGDVISSFKEHLNLTLIKQKNSGPASARNNGAKIAKGKYLIFIDDDCTVPPDWLKSITKHLSINDDLTIGGQVINDLLDNIYSTASQILIDYSYEHYNSNPERASFLVSTNFVIPLDIFNKFGGFLTTFPLAAGEDREFCDRLFNKNRMIYVPEIITYHFHSHTFKTFFLQHFNYGGGAFKYHNELAKRKEQYVRHEQFLFYIKLILCPMFKVKGLRIFPLLFLMFLSQIGNFLGFLLEFLIKTR